MSSDEMYDKPKRERDPLDPSSLLPFEVHLEPEDPTVKKLPKTFQGTMGKGIFDNQPRYNDM